MRQPTNPTSGSLYAPTIAILLGFLLTIGLIWPLAVYADTQTPSSPAQPVPAQITSTNGFSQTEVTNSSVSSDSLPFPPARFYIPIFTAPSLPTVTEVLTWTQNITQMATMTDIIEVISPDFTIDITGTIVIPTPYVEATPDLEAKDWTPDQINLTPTLDLDAINYTPTLNLDYTFNYTPQISYDGLITEPTVDLTHTLNITPLIPLTYLNFITLTVEDLISQTEAISETEAYFGPALELLDGIITYTNELSEANAQLQSQESFTIVTAPDWYAPGLPRPVANIGWTYEVMATGEYGIDSWIQFSGHITPIPFQFVAGLAEWLAGLGPLGLFVGWVMTMATFSTVMTIINFIKTYIQSLFEQLYRLVAIIYYVYRVGKSASQSAFGAFQSGVIVLLAVLNWIYDGIKTAGLWVWNNLLWLWTKAVELVRFLYVLAVVGIDLLKTYATNLYQGVTNYISMGATGTVTGAQTLFNWGLTALQTAWETLLWLAGKLVDAYQIIIANGYQTVVLWSMRAVAIASQLPGIISGIAAGISAVAGGISISMPVWGIVLIVVAVVVTLLGLLGVVFSEDIFDYLTLLLDLLDALGISFDEI